MASAYGNRLVKPNADRSVTLKRGRLYRLLIVANGTPAEEEIRQSLYGWGLDEHDLAVSWPGEWAEHRPRDWPKEGAVEDLAANEFLLRVSGSQSGPMRTIGHDSPIAGNAANGTLTIIGAWEYGPASEESMREPEPEEVTEQEKNTRSTVLWLALAIFGGGMIYKFTSTRSGMSREQEAYERVAVRADRARRASRVRELMATGHDHRDAHAIAEHEEWDRAEHEHALAHEHQETAGG
jgi:hypothetical protein